MTTPCCPSSSHQALLGIIEEKERELIRIRHAANSAAEEEKKTTLQKFIDLQSDHEHNVKVLHDKDEEIKKLQCKVHSMEVEYIQSKREVEDRCQQMMNRHVEQMEYRLREETRQHADTYEVEQRKKLQIEYENKLLEKEKNLQIEYQRSLVDELRDQEGRIQRKFEKIIDERESDRRDVEREWKTRLAEKDRENSEMCREFEVQWRHQEQSIIRDLETKHESKTKMEVETLKNEYKRYMSDQEHEIDKALRDVQRLEKDKVKLEEEKATTEARVGELLNVVKCMENGYSEKTFEYEQEMRSLQLRLMRASEEMSAMEVDMRRRDVGYRKEMDILKRRNKDDRKASRIKMRELKRELISANEERDERKQSLALTEGEVERSKKRLKDKVASMTQECICLRDEIRSLNEKVAVGEQNESFRNEEQRRILSERKAADTHARKKIMEQFERTMQKDRDDFARERLRLEKERDNALLDKESADTELEHWREEVARVKGHCSSVMNQHREDVDALRRENSDLKAKYNEERQGSLRMKNTLADMRREMEELMAACSSATITASSNGRGEELPSVLSREDDDLCEFKKEIARVKRNLHQGKRYIADESDTVPDKVEILQENMNRLSSEYNTVSTERDNLLEISNKLRSELTRLRNHQRRDEDSVQSYRDKGQSQVLNQTFEELDVDDLARSVWNKAVVKPAVLQREMKTSARSSDRATHSQKESFQRLRMKQPDSRNGRKGKGLTKIRNWNIKTDN